MNNRLAYLATIAFYLAAGFSSPAKAIIAEGVTTGVLLDKFHGQFSSLIDKARDSGDFLIWRVAITGRDLIDTLERSNKELLNVAFDKLDKQKQDLLRGIDANIDKISNQREIAFNQAENITGEWSQIISSTYLSSSRPFIINYYPRVLIPDGDQSIRLKITGPNIGRSSPRLSGKLFEAIKPTTPVDQTAIFTLNKSAFSFPEGGYIVQRLDVSYNVPKYVVLNDKATNNLEFWLLPRAIGHYKISTRVISVNREIANRVVNLGQFKGRNSRIHRAVLVPDTSLGWRLDLTRRGEIRLQQGGADKGRCEGVEDQSITENGLTMFARVDNRDRLVGRRDAWTDCSISIPVYRETKIEVEGAGAEGDLSWTKDTTFKLPSDMKSLSVRVDTFDKRSKVFTGAGTDKFFDIRVEGGQLIFRPNPPKDF